MEVGSGGEVREEKGIRTGGRDKVRRVEEHV